MALVAAATASASQEPFTCLVRSRINGRPDKTTWVNNGHTYYVLSGPSTWAKAEE
jgi:hypothetical protein